MMRRILTLALFLAVVLLGYAAAREACAAVSDEGRSDCVMESGAHARQHHAILFKTDGSEVSSPARAQTARGVEVPDEPAFSEVLSKGKISSVPNVSSQTVTQQNIVERK